MLYDLRNPTQGTRVIHDGPEQVEVRVAAGATLEGRELERATIDRAEAMGLIATPSGSQGPALPALVIEGMWGIGDCLHQRAVVVELMKTHEVWLSTCQWHLHHDLVAKGLHLIYKTTRLRGQVLTQEREGCLFPPAPTPPSKARRIKNWYRKDQIDKFGSILEAMFGNCFLPVPSQGDFRFPLRPEWLAAADELIARWNPDGLPLMIYRPIVFRPEWNSANRNPLPEAYAEFFEVARKGYRVVSLAYLHPRDEMIVGPGPKVDVKVHDGSVPVEIMAAVVARAQMVFCNAGFMPVLAQSVGTPSIVVYGGRESFRTTQRAGAHLAPTLGVDVDKPCDCHTERHACDKRLTVSRWIEKVRTFAEEHRNRVTETVECIEREPASAELVIAAESAGVSLERAGSQGLTYGSSTASMTLIFGTVYVDSPERQRLTAQWLELTTTLNPDCDILLVDSMSPLPALTGAWVDRFSDSALYMSNFGNRRLYRFNFNDNIGHLSRKGRDGWGRAFCKGLELAIERGYDYVAHIEGDSLLRLPVSHLITMMRKAGRCVATTPVRGMPRDMPGWVETGLMVFETAWLKRTDFVKRYDWPNRLPNPTPEVIVARLIADSVLMLPIKAQRSDKKQITHQNVVSLDLDWITHCHNDIWCYDRFLEAALVRWYSLLRESKALESEGAPFGTGEKPGQFRGAHQQQFKLNLGCGTNKIPGWQNHDADVDITKSLPWPDNSADFIFIEHCVEHVSFHQAIRFFEEAFRVLRPGGALRVTVPSIEQIATLSEADYWKFTEKWGGEPTLKGALRAIIFAHGHQQAWTASLMRHALEYVGFRPVGPRKVGESPYEALRGVEGHGAVIGEKFNAIESMPFEGTKPGVIQTQNGRPIAIVLGGANCVWSDLEKAHADCERFGLKPTYFVTNDMLTEFDGECVAVTLHPNTPNKLVSWLPARREKGYPEPSAIWAHHKTDPRFSRVPLVTDVADDWAGSSGLFAFQVARKSGFDKVLLCGVPMIAEMQHFKRGVNWIGAAKFIDGWNRHMKEIAPFARSYSGWTAEKLGTPGEEFFA